MLEVISFILRCVSQVAKMLFSINIGNGISLGLLMCFCFILLPITHRVLCFIRQDAMEELSDTYNENKKSSKRGRD